MRRHPKGCRPAIGSGGALGPSRRARRRAAAGLLLAGALAVAGCTGPATTSASGSGPGARMPRLVWLFTARALRLVTGPSPARQLLAVGRVYELAGGGSGTSPTHPPVRVTVVAGFASEALLSSWLDSAGAGPGTPAVLYDPEAWAATPAGEQRAIAASLAAAGSAARRHHKVLLASPGLDLARLLMPAVQPSWRAYLDLGLARDAALAAPVVIVQAQSLERQPSAYRAFVSAAVAQARAARPDVVVLSGLSTNPPGPVVTLDQLERSATAVLPSVDGFWLNVPQPGTSCPRCHESRGALGAALLSFLARQGGRAAG